MNTNLKRNFLKSNNSRIRLLKKFDIDKEVSFDEYVQNI